MPIIKYFEEGAFDSLKDLLERLQGSEVTLHDWEVDLMDYLKRLIHKKKLFDFNRHHFILDDETKDYFTVLELKLLSLISDSDYRNLVSERSFQIEICRVCCHHKPKAMLNIFSSSGSADGLSFATKISVCVDMPVEEQDTLPKSICRDCAQNLDTCYEFQRLCRESDYELRRDKKLRDMIMDQVLDKTMGCIVDSGWSSSSNSDLLKSLDVDKAPFEDNNNRMYATGEGFTVGTDTAGDMSELVPQSLSSPYPISSPSSSSSSSSLAEENCDIKKFQCELCGARFFDIYNFKTHWRIHKIVKKYECQVQGCGKKFRTNVMLKIHSRCGVGASGIGSTKPNLKHFFF